MPLTYVELFAGAGGLSLGLEAGGFAPVAHCEIEPHARAVLRHRWPSVPLFGDVTAVDGRQFAGVTLVSGGSPCQDLSVAGKRAGLAGARSGLFHEQVRIWRESGAPYFLWENVLGALSSNNGRDFGTVLSTLVGATLPVPSDGWRGGGVAAGPDAVAAWRVLDLQHFGPPQRRVRVFVVAARTGGVDPAEVLALSEGVCGHPSPREQQRQSAAAGTRAGAPSSGLAFHHTQDPISGDVSPATLTTMHDPQYLVHPTLNTTHFGKHFGCNQHVNELGTILPAIGRPRRLTPLECERLMSWPDQWTATGIKEDGTEYALSDTARYRLCGNGVGSVCVAWFAKRLADLIETQ